MSDRLPRPAPRAAFRASLRDQLLREAPSALMPAPRTAGWWRPLAAAVATVMLVVAADTAAARSLPGEAPFAIKRTVEEGRLLLAFDEQARMEILADHALARLAEVQLATTGIRGADAAEASSGLAQALGRLADAVARAKRAAPAASGDDQPRSTDELRGVGRAEKVAREQADAIEKLLPSAAGPARDALERAVEQTKKIRATPPASPPRGR